MKRLSKHLLAVALILPIVASAETHPVHNSIVDSDLQQSTNSWEEHALIRAKPARVKKLGDIQCPENDICIGALYSVQLRNIKVVHGTLRSRRLTVKLTASSKTAISNANRIIVLVDTTTESPNALTWSIPNEFACFQSDLVGGAEMVSKFHLIDTKTRYSGRPDLQRVCTNAK